MARKDSMAVIDAALQQPEAVLAPTNPDEGLPGVQPTPEVDLIPNSLTAGEKRAYDVRRQMAQDERQQELERKAETNQIALEEAQELQRLREEKDAQRSEFEKTARATAAGLKNTIQSVGARTGSLPTPGSLALPLLLLGVFFLLLIPVNGHTRFTWLWLVFTGNAEIQQSSSSGSSSSSSTSGSTTDTGTATLTVPIIPAAPGNNGIVPLSQTGNGTYVAEDF